MRRCTLVLVVVALVCGPVHAATNRGGIQGRLTLEDGRPVPGVRVSVNETSVSTHSDSDGRYALSRLAAGTYSLTFRWADQTATRSAVTVEAGSTTTVDEVLAWKIGLFEGVTVTAVSRRPERIVDAPASVTTISANEIERQAAHGQIPKLFEFTPGVEITQISAAEFLVSTRGFNGNLNRRVAVQVDGRDLTDPFVGAMEWATVSYPLDDFDHAELVRGPAAALYGANATGGVFNLTTKAPRDSRGGLLRVAAGELGSTNVDFRWAGGLGGGWYTRVTGGVRKSDGYSVSRLVDTEYSVPCPPPAPGDCLPLDAIPFPEDQIDIAFGAVRFDRYLDNGMLLTLEGGTTEYGGPVFLSVGRGQINDVERPWGRLNVSGEHWNVLANYSEREAMTTNLGNGNPFLLDADNLKIEGQTHWDLVQDKVRLVAGASHLEENVDSNLMGGPASIDEQALFAQVDWDLGRHVKLVGALRWDDSSLYDSRVSPKGSVVYRVSPEHTLRLTYNEAFQLPTYADFFLEFPLFDSDINELSGICSGANVDCGLGASATNFFFGNESLRLEEVTTLELGYKGVLGNKAFLTVDLWDAESENFLTNSAQITPSGRVNPNIAFWVGSPASEMTPIDPADCPAMDFTGKTVADCVRAHAPSVVPPGTQLTNLDGATIIAFATSTNFGQVDTRGVDLGLQYFFDQALRLSFSYSWFDFDIRRDTGGNPGLLLPNSPEHKASLGVSYVADRWNASVRGRWVDEFLWSANPAGTVDSYTVVDLHGNYRLTGNWTVGLAVANVFDDEHWQAFGADLITRRALVHVTTSW